jgi:hypothetical protein
MAKLRQHLVYLGVHLSQPCWVDESPLISMIDLLYGYNAFCLYVASLLIKPRLTE